jgi:potassium-transporting ATPase KdpC subunit
MKEVIRKSLMLSIVMLVLCGFIYPLAMTGISQLAFNKKANGSIVMFNGKEVGSELIGQNFTDPRFFHGRVSAINYNTYTVSDTKPDSQGNVAYKGVSSGSSNLGPSNKALTERVQKDMDNFLKNHPSIKKEDIPTDLLTSSASGLDPDVSPDSAKIQIGAVSKATGISTDDLNDIISRNTKGRTLGIFGEPRVNVLMVNLEIASILKSKGSL